MSYGGATGLDPLVSRFRENHFLKKSKMNEKTRVLSVSGRFLSSGSHWESLGIIWKKIIFGDFR